MLTFPNSVSAIKEGFGFSVGFGVSLGVGAGCGFKSHVGRPVYEYHRSHCLLWWYGFPVDATAVANAQSHKTYMYTIPVTLITADHNNI